MMCEFNSRITDNNTKLQRRDKIVDDTGPNENYTFWTKTRDFDHNNKHRNEEIHDLPF